jgi:hypothetical protein
MDLWDTNSGDRWLCEFCQKKFIASINKEKWRLVFKKVDPELRCSECGHGDVNMED